MISFWVVISLFEIIKDFFKKRSLQTSAFRCVWILWPKNSINKMSFIVMIPKSIIGNVQRQVLCTRITFVLLHLFQKFINTERVADYDVKEKAWKCHVVEWIFGDIIKDMKLIRITLAFRILISSLRSLHIKQLKNSYAGLHLFLVYNDTIINKWV